jgi:hypothetical protein
MAIIYFLGSRRTAPEVLGDETVLVDSLVECIDPQTEEEQLVLRGIMSAIVAEGVNTSSGWLWVYDEKDEDDNPYAYMEVTLLDEHVAKFPPSLVARTDQDIEEAWNGLSD